MIEIAVPESLMGQTVAESKLRQKYSVWIVAIKEAMTGKIHMLPDPSTTFGSDQILMIIGRNEDLNQFQQVK